MNAVTEAIDRATMPLSRRITNNRLAQKLLIPLDIAYAAYNLVKALAKFALVYMQKASDFMGTPVFASIVSAAATISLIAIVMLTPGGMTTGLAIAAGASLVGGGVNVFMAFKKGTGVSKAGTILSSALSYAFIIGFKINGWGLVISAIPVLAALFQDRIDIDWFNKPIEGFGYVGDFKHGLAVEALKAEHPEAADAFDGLGWLGRRAVKREGLIANVAKEINAKGAAIAEQDDPAQSKKAVAAYVVAKANIRLSQKAQILEKLGFLPPELKALAKPDNVLVRVYLFLTLASRAVNKSHASGM